MFFVLAGGLFWGFSLLNIFGLFGHFKNWKERWGMIAFIAAMAVIAVVTHPDGIRQGITDLLRFPYLVLAASQIVSTDF
jgi:hypothetical protein